MCFHWLTETQTVRRAPTTDILWSRPVPEKQNKKHYLWVCIYFWPKLEQKQYMKLINQKWSDFCLDNVSICVCTVHTCAQCVMKNRNNMKLINQKWSDLCLGNASICVLCAQCISKNRNNIKPIYWKWLDLCLDNASICVCTAHTCVQCARKNRNNMKPINWEWSDWVTFVLMMRPYVCAQNNCSWKEATLIK